ncbi:MAG TPA: FecR domain-containing protein [Pontibacter sp.]
MTQDEYMHLYERYLSGECSPEEIKRLEQFNDQFTLEDLPWNEEEMGDKELTEQAIMMALNSSIRTSIQPEKKPLPWRSLAAAVALLLLAVGGFMWFRSAQEQPRLTQAPQEQLNEPITPGGDVAILTLADGTQLALTDQENGRQWQQGEAGVLEAAGQLIYKKDGAKGVSEHYNTVATPRGGQYQVVLSDGTKVWLNAASSLKFPVAFAGKDRVVELTGEAYFEVAKDKERPFRVQAKGMDIKVLGTHFNVMAYEDEHSVQATLLEGAVEVSSSGSRMLLQPGQQASLLKTAHVLVKKEVDVSDVVAWKQGLFSFNGASLPMILNQVSRWYNVDVHYQDPIANRHYTGLISRQSKIEDVLQILELTGDVTFEIKNREIHVRKKD